jgi:hypothetical protein
MPDGTNADEMNAFYNQLGRPETVDGYDFDMVDVDHDSSFNGFKEAAHRNGLTSAQAEGMLLSSSPMSLNALRAPSILPS